MTAGNNPSVKPPSASQSGSDLSPSTGNGSGRNPLGEQLATCLKVMLEAQGMSQADLAREMGLSTKHVNQMVQGKSGALAMYDYAAFTLGCRWSVTLEPMVNPGRTTRTEND